MRRFSRRRRGGQAREGSAPIDADKWLAQVVAASLVEAQSLSALDHEDVPDSYAAVGRGESASGAPIVVAVAPRHGGDALLAALATGARLAAEESFDGEVVAIAPEWSIAARRRLGAVRVELPFKLRTLAAPSLGGAEVGVEAEGELEPTVLTVGQVVAQLSEAADRALFERAAAALEGLASKHAGTVRGTANRLELVVMARRVAELRAETGRIALVTLEPQRNTTTITADGLAGALDALEGQVRRRLNDRRARDGEEGMRSRLVPLLADARGLREPVAWPIGGADPDPVDLVGLDDEGRPVAAAARNEFTLPALGQFLDAVQSLRLALPTVMSGVRPPVRLEAPRLALAAEAFASGTLRALAGFALAHELFEIRPDRNGGYALASIGAEEAMRALRDRPARRRRPGRGRQGAESDEPKEETTEGAAEEAAPSADENGGKSEARGRSRRRGRRRGRGRSDDEPRESGEAVEATPAEADGADEAEEGRPRFEEVSLFDLDDGASEAGEEPSGGRRRRGRGGRRGRRGGSGGNGGGDDGAAQDDAPKARGRRDGSGDEEDEEEFAADDLTEVLAELPDELAPDTSPTESEDDEDEESEGDPRADAREARRRARKAKPPEAEPEPPRPPRRKAVIVARADRDALVSAILLARDIRLLDGLWIYPQEELMGFFREIATEVRDDVPIHVVGFVPSPAIDVLQAASLYRDRISWYDHHPWAPEDDMALKQAVGEEAVHHTPGAGSSLPSVLETCTRRSRFSDKLVDLATGRFTQHDYERWGRLWWWRLGEIAQKRGDVRSDVSALLTGRPSDLSKEAARHDAPPIPEEVAYVSGRDMRLVHFVGYGMVVAEVDEGFDLHLVGRIARERYAAQLSLLRRTGSDLFLFGGEELAGRRMLDFGALVDHLANKLDWAEALPDQDHVARFRIVGLDEHPSRLDEVIGEIAMGRSILER